MRRVCLIQYGPPLIGVKHRSRGGEETAPDVTYMLSGPGRLPTGRSSFPMRPWSITPASCSLLILVACGSDTAGPSAPPLLLEIAGGNGQRAFVGAATPQPLAVRVVTYTRDPRPGVPVTFALETGDARLEATEARTDTSGVASVPLDLGEKAGPVVVTASGTDLRGSPVTFVLTATPDFSSRPSIATVSSEAVAGFVGHDFLFPAAVLVTDRFDK